MDKRVNYSPFRKEIGVIMANLYNYEVRAVSLDEVEGNLSKRLSRGVCRLAKHFESRDILMYIMGFDRGIASRLKLDFTGENVIELAIEELCQKMYEQDYEVFSSFPENKMEIKTHYRFECKFTAIVLE